MRRRAQYLLDTDTVSDLVRNPQGKIASRIAEVGQRSVATSVVVAAELRFGSLKKGSPRLTDQLNTILRALDERDARDGSRARQHRRSPAFLARAP